VKVQCLFDHQAQEMEGCALGTLKIIRYCVEDIAFGRAPALFSWLFHGRRLRDNRLNPLAAQHHQRNDTLDDLSSDMGRFGFLAYIKPCE